MSTELTLLPTPQQLGEMSKKELAKLAQDTAAGVVNHGVLNSLEVYIRAKKLTEFATELAKAMKDQAEKEARLEQSKGAFEKYGAKITHSSGRSTWHYDNCNDPIYKSLLAEKKDIDERVKEREKFLQSVPEGGLQVLDTNSGEVCDVRRAVKVDGAETITITY